MKQCVKECKKYVVVVVIVVVVQQNKTKRCRNNLQFANNAFCVRLGVCLSASQLSRPLTFCNTLPLSRICIYVFPSLTLSHIRSLLLYLSHTHRYTFLSLSLSLLYKRFLPISLSFSLSLSRDENDLRSNSHLWSKPHTTTTTSS